MPWLWICYLGQICLWIYWQFLPLQRISLPSNADAVTVEMWLGSRLFAFVPGLGLLEMLQDGDMLVTFRYRRQQYDKPIDSRDDERLNNLKCLDLSDSVSVVRIDEPEEVVVSFSKTDASMHWTRPAKAPR